MERRSEGKSMHYNESTIHQETDEPDHASGIYFCPDGNTAREISRSEISPEKKQRIRSLHVLHKRWNLVIPLHYAIWLTSALLAIRSHVLTVDLVLYVIGGLSLSTLSVLAHESSHNLFTRNPAIDRALGFFCGLPVLFSVAGYRVVHPLHHKFLHSEQDPDDIENVSANPALLRIVYVFIFLAGVYLYLITVPLNALRKGTRDDRVRIIVEGLAMALIAAGSCMLLPFRFILKGWFYPLLVAGQFANLRGIAEHGLTTGGNELTDTRTVTTHPALAFMMCNINYHLEHHLYPGIPWYNLPRLHQLLHDEYVAAGSSVYRSYATFLWDVAKALTHGVVPGARLIPSHIREVVCL